MSLLPIVDVCDNFRPNEHKLIPFCLTNDRQSAVGLLWPEILPELEEDNERSKKSVKPTPWTIVLSNEGAGKCHLAHFASHLDSPSARSVAIQTLTKYWHDNGKFADVIGGRLWRNELYPVYRNAFGPHDDNNFAFEMERAACALFGLVTYGVHMTIYRLPTPGSDEEIKLWVPTRSSTKQTWPGFLDNTIAGGIPSGMSPFESLVKEAMEEGSLQEDVVRKHTRAVGSISYFYRTQLGWLQPEVQYIYDLAVPPNLKEDELSRFIPAPLDGEVESFECLPISIAIQKMKEKLFKPNCALVLLDFMIRHGLITAENEPNFLEIMTRLHGRFDIDNW